MAMIDENKIKEYVENALFFQTKDGIFGSIVSFDNCKDSYLNLKKKILCTLMNSDCMLVHEVSNFCYKRALIFVDVLMS